MKLGFLFRIFFALRQLRHAHVRKDTRLSLLFHTVSNEKLDGGLGTRLISFSIIK